MRNPTIAIVVIILVAAGIYFWKTNMTPKPAENTNAGMLSERKQAIAEEGVAYADGKRGFFVHPEATGSYPGIVLVHEWWGLNDTMKEQARTLASQGYNVIAVDLFGTVATTPAEAMFTRGMRGCYVYFMDEGAKNYFKSRIES